MSELDIDKTYKLIMIGDSGVGKTCILQMFTTSKFITQTRTTIGADFASKILKIDDKIINLNIWDTAGQEIYRSITNQYYRQAAGVFLVYDVSNPTTFKNIKKWIKDLKNNCDEESIVKLLIGNKIDLVRTVAQEEALALANKLKMGYIETSASSNVNIDKAFEEMTKIILSSRGSFMPEIKVNVNQGGPSHKLIHSEETSKKQKTKNGNCCCGKDSTA